MVAIVADDVLALQRLYHWETTAPDRVALTQPVGGGEVRDYTWRDVLDQSRRMANHLQRRGLQPGDRVGILSKNTAHWLMSDFAIWLAGGVSVPLYPTLAAGTIRQILGHSESKLMFVGKLDEWDRVRAGLPTSVVCISLPLSPEEVQRNCPRWDDIVAMTPRLEGEPARPGESLATIIYTSGTTGMAKGVMWSFAAFARQVQALLRNLGVNSSTRLLSYLPLSHIAERVIIEHVQLGVGARAFFSERLETFSADLQRARPTFFLAVPRLWVKFQQAVINRLPSEQVCRQPDMPRLDSGLSHQILVQLGLDQCGNAWTSAAPMPPELLRWYQKIGLHINEAYGMTEIGATHVTEPTEQAFGTVGRPLDGVQCRLESSTREIQIKCPWLMLGYYKAPELTLQTFTDDGWLRTGDKGSFDVSGNLMITGRVKDLFKTSKGEYVAPAPIEHKIVMHAAVEACCVTGSDLAQPIGLLMLNEAAVQMSENPQGRIELEASLAAHLSAVNESLVPHERLDCLVVMIEAWTVDNGLVTPTFKVKRNQVEGTFARHYETWVSVGKPILWHDR